MKSQHLLLLFCLTLNVATADTAEFNLCYDFGCKSTQELSFDETQWNTIALIFEHPALSPWLEKQQIRQAIALMEKYSGSVIGTTQDKGGNYPGVDLPYQLDCIDESSNTTQYLHALQLRKLLHWHKVGEKQRRIVWLATHWTAVIHELQSGDHYAVDSWYLDNGEPPFIQKIADWKRKASFSERLNP